MQRGPSCKGISIHAMSIMKKAYRISLFMGKLLTCWIMIIWIQLQIKNINMKNKHEKICIRKRMEHEVSISTTNCTWIYVFLLVFMSFFLQIHALAYAYLILSHLKWNLYSYSLLFLNIHLLCIHLLSLEYFARSWIFLLVSAAFILLPLSWMYFLWDVALAFFHCLVKNFSSIMEYYHL